MAMQESSACVHSYWKEQVGDPASQGVTDDPAVCWSGRAVSRHIYVAQ